MKQAKVFLWGALALGACGDEHDATGLSTEAVQTVCVDSVANVPTDAWQCGQPLTIQCGGSVPPLYVRDDCGRLEATSVSTTRTGTQSVNVLRGDGSLSCSSQLTVLAGAPALSPRTRNIWPPNHKFHSFSPADCLGDYAACDPTVRAEFAWASSDEPVDDLGDGHFAPDIVFDGCDRVQLRSERQGPKDGRVYKLGVRVIDASGAAREAVCTVIVDHDQRGVLAADSGEAYRVSTDGTNGAPLCDGRSPPLVTPDASVPPSSPPVVGF